MTPTLEKLISRNTEQYEDTWEEGRTISSMRSQYGDEKYERAVLRGDIVERQNNRGKMMAYEQKEKVAGKREALSHVRHAAKVSGFKEDQFHAIAMELASDAMGWCKFGLTGEDGDKTLNVSSSSTHDLSVEQAMRRVQEAYDSCTKTASNIRDSSRELLKCVSADSLQATLTRECVVKLRAMEPHTQKLEDLLFNTSASPPAIQLIKKVLHDAAVVYKALYKSEQELTEIAISEAKKAKRRMQPTDLDK